MVGLQLAAAFAVGALLGCVSAKPIATDEIADLSVDNAAVPVVSGITKPYISNVTKVEVHELKKKKKKFDWTSEMPHFTRL